MFYELVSVAVYFSFFVVVVCGVKVSKNLVIFFIVYIELFFLYYIDNVLLLIIIINIYISF